MPDDPDNQQIVDDALDRISARTSSGQPDNSPWKYYPVHLSWEVSVAQVAAPYEEIPQPRIILNRSTPDAPPPSAAPDSPPEAPAQPSAPTPETAQPAPEAPPEPPAPEPQAAPSAAAPPIQNTAPPPPQSPWQPMVESIAASHADLNQWWQTWYPGVVASPEWRMNVSNRQLIAYDRKLDPFEMADRYVVHRNDYARRNFGVENPSDTQFYQLARGTIDPARERHRYAAGQVMDLIHRPLFSEQGPDGALTVEQFLPAVQRLMQEHPADRPKVAGIMLNRIGVHPGISAALPPEPTGEDQGKQTDSAAEETAGGTPDDGGRYWLRLLVALASMEKMRMETEFEHGGDYVTGAMQGYAEANGFGGKNPPPGGPLFYRAGRITGHLAALVQGGAEFMNGGTAVLGGGAIDLGGLAITPTGVGALVGVPAEIAGTALATGGAC